MRYSCLAKSFGVVCDASHFVFQKATAVVSESVLKAARPAKDSWLPRRVALGIIVWALLPMGVQADSATPPTWSDEFNGTGAPSSSNWTFEEGFMRNQELQWYTTSNAWQEAGQLVIEGRRECFPNPWYNPNYNPSKSDAWKYLREYVDYTSSSIRTVNKYSFQYGRMQVRGQIPCLAGMWPAIWTLGDTGEWPSNGECDIMEYYGSQILANCARGTVDRWVAAWDSSHTLMSTLTAQDPDWKTKHHVWTLQWDESYVRLYVDNLLLNTTPQTWLVNPVETWGPKDPFKQPHNILLNLAIGGTAGGDPSGTDFPQRYYLDYVRVWESYTNNVAPTNITLSANTVGEGLPAGTVVGTLTAGDDDPAEVFRYTLVAGTGDTHNSQFSIPAFLSDNTTQCVVKTAAVLNYSDGATRSIRVRVTDIEGATYEKVLTVNVTGAAAIDVSSNALVIAEGNTVSFGVKLRVLPSNTVTINVSRVSGDTDLSVQSGAQLYFTPANGTNWQQVTIAAAEDADWTNGAALLLCEDAGGLFSSVNVTATEADNDNDLPLVDAGEDRTIQLEGLVSWTPAEMATVAWYDAADASTILTNDAVGKVSRWSDKSGNNRDASQASTGNQPTYVASDAMVNNMPSIGNSASSGQIGLQTPSFAAKNVYVVMYYKDGTDSSFDVYSTLFSGPGVNGEYRVMGNQSTDDFISTYTFNNAGTYKNGSEINTVSDVLPMPVSILKFKSIALREQVYALGYNQLDSNRDWQGMYCEWIFTDGSEDAATEKQIEGYLAHKWGLAESLPSDHPYKGAKPMMSAANIDLDGCVSDPNGDSFSTAWSVLSGPDSVGFADASGTNTTATFTSTGVYVLRLTADDGVGEAFDDVTITVSTNVVSTNMIVSTNSVLVAEGATSSFDVKLSLLPESTTTVTVSRVSGDTDLTVQSGAELIFTPANGTNWQQVVLAAAEDADSTNGTASFQVVDASGAFDSASVGADELDNDKTPATVTLGDLSQTYDGTAREATATTDPAGLTVTFTYDGSAIAPTNAGSYAVTGTVVSATYDGMASGTLVVTPAALTVTPDTGLSKVLGDPDPVLTYSTTGEVAGQTPGFTGALSREAGETIGSYPVQQGTLALADNGTFLAANYTLDFTTVVLFTIGGKSVVALTIAPVGPFVYDGSAKTPEPEVKDGETVLALATDYTLSYADNTDAGVATLTLTGMGDYFGVTNTSFTITQATPVVSTWPTGSVITVGQPLSVSTLDGGSASVPGTFSFDAPETVPPEGVYTAAVTFAATDRTNYADVSGTAAVTVNPLPPAVPTGLVATVSAPGQVSLVWSAVDEATSYHVKRASGTGGPYTTLASTADTNYLDTTASNGMTYYYVVSSVDTGVEGSDSDEASVTLQHAIPFLEDFEARTLGDLEGQNGWVATGALVQDALVFGGTKAGSVTDEVGTLSHPFVGSAGKVWSDMRAQTVFAPEPPVPPEGTTASFYVSTNGQVMAYDGTTAVASGAKVAEGTWVRYTLCADYGTSSWTLYVDGKPYGTYAFYDASRTLFEEYGVSGGITALDDLAVTADRPAGLAMPMTVILIQ